MKLFTLTDYIESILNPNERFRELQGIYAHTEDGNPVIHSDRISANFHVVHRDRLHVLCCLTDNSTGTRERIREISSFVELIDSPYIVPFRYLENEMLVFDTNHNGHTYIDVVLHEIPRGERLDHFLERISPEGSAPEEIETKGIETKGIETKGIAAERSTIPAGELIEGLAGMCRWLVANKFSHGRISLKSIWITPEQTPVLFDYSRASRSVPKDDVLNLASAAVAIFLSSNDPRFATYMIAECNAATGVRRSLRDLILSLDGKLGCDVPAALTRVIEKIAEGASVDIASLCDAMDELALCKPANTKPLSSMLDAQEANAPQKNRKPAKYKFIGETYDMLRKAYDGEYWHYLDKNGEAVIGDNFTYAHDFHEGLAVVETKEGLGVINRDGGWVVPPEYGDIFIDSPSNRLVVTKDGKTGLFSREFEEITGFIYDRIMSYNIHFCAELNGRYGYIDRDGKVVIDFIYDDASSFDGDKAHVILNGRQYLIDANGDIIDEVKSSQPKHKTIVVKQAAS